MMKTLITGVALVFCASSYAATVTFDAVPHVDEFATSYSEAGINISSMGGDLGYDWRPGVVHLDDFGTSLTNAILVTTGSTFTPELLNLLGFREVVLNYAVFDPNDPDGSWIEGTIVTTGAVVRGYRGSVRVAEQRLSAVAQPNYVFGSAFAGIDALEVVAEVDMDSPMATLELEYPGYVIANLDCGEEVPCSHFEVDSISINTAPSVRRECPHSKKPRPKKPK